MNCVINDIQGYDAYIDVDHMSALKKLFDNILYAKLTVNLAKTEFCHGTVTFLGHVVGQGHVRPVTAKVKAITDFPTPTGKRQLMRFLGMSGYYRKFCPNFSSIAAPLTQLLKKGVDFLWSDDCRRAFDQLKALLSSSPILLAPDFSKEFKLAVDASDVDVV